MAKEKKAETPATETTAAASTDATAPAAATEVAVVTPAAVAVGGSISIGGLKFKVKDQVTMPLLKQKDGEAVYVKLVGAIFVGKEIKNKRSGEVEQKPAMMVNVINLENHRPMQYIVNAVLQGTLEDDPRYNEKKYVGKSFAILKLPQGEGKRYKNFEVMEIETDGEVAETV
jgi:hypothetical protein